MKINRNYLMAFIILFTVEALIAVFVHDSVIRPYIGDVLVVILIYCGIKVFIARKIKFLPLYIFLFAGMVEVSQYFKLADRLYLAQNSKMRIIIGSTFDFSDLACYFAGGLILFLWQRIYRK